MSTELLQPFELRAKGFAALVQALGWVNAVRFIQQYEPSAHDYTAERPAILPKWDPTEMVSRMNQSKKSDGK